MLYLMDFTSLGFQLPLLLCCIPGVMALPSSAPFPNINFKDFSEFILENFGENISLSTVFMLSLSITNNTEVLSLHFKQSRNGNLTSWINCLARGIKNQLDQETMETLFLEHELNTIEGSTAQDPEIAYLSKKLSKLSQILALYPYNCNKKFTGTLKPISHDSIKPALLICPNTSVCLTSGCNFSCLYQSSNSVKDISVVTLIEDTNIHFNVQVLGGKCKMCKTIYYADCERISVPKPEVAKHFYLNSARYLNIGQKLWVNRKFSSGVLNAIYHLHASTSGWTNFFNSTYGDNNFKISHRHIWNAFQEETIRQNSDATNIDFYVNESASSNEVMQIAFGTLGKKGIIQLTENHACEECSQPYKKQSDFIATTNDPSAVLEDNNTSIPIINSVHTTEMDVDGIQNVTMVVLDGIVVGTKVFHIYD